MIYLSQQGKRIINYDDACLCTMNEHCSPVRFARRNERSSFTQRCLYLTSTFLYFCLKAYRIPTSDICIVYTYRRVKEIEAFAFKSKSGMKALWAFSLAFFYPLHLIPFNHFASTLLQSLIRLSLFLLRDKERGRQKYPGRECVAGREKCFWKGTMRLYVWFVRVAREGGRYKYIRGLSLHSARQKKKRKEKRNKNKNKQLLPSLRLGLVCIHVFFLCRLMKSTSG